MISDADREVVQMSDTAPGMLLDRFGRQARDLRISVTDRCNLRCTYCMPAEGLPWLPKQSVLDADEIVRLVRIGVTLLGIREVRFSGGEPLVRPDLTEIIAKVAELSSRPSISVTTNGLTLAAKASDLATAGLDRVNVSLDTVDAARFAGITRRDRHADVLAGLAAAHDAGLRPVKVNSVLMRGVNDDEAPELLAFCLAHGYELRFIEQMPLDADHSWSRTEMITADEILASLRTRYALRPLADLRGASPAEHFVVDGHVLSDGSPARVGVIASVTRPFCGDCDRTRVTADGQVRSCLFSTTEDDLRTLLRNGSGDEAISAAWQGAMWRKAAGHGINSAHYVQPVRTMSAIGG